MCRPALKKPHFLCKALGQGIKVPPWQRELSSDFLAHRKSFLAYSLTKLMKIWFAVENPLLWTSLQCGIMMVWFDKCRIYIWNIFIRSCIYFLLLKRTRSNMGPNRTTGRICASLPVQLWFGGCSMAMVSTCQQSGLETGTAAEAYWIFLFNLFLFTWHSLGTAVQPQWGHLSSQCGMSCLKFLEGNFE